MNRATYAQPAAFVWNIPAVQADTISAARSWTRARLTEQALPGKTIDDAQLIVSELLTNVLRRAPGAAELTLAVERTMLTITCADSGDTPVQSGSPDPGSAHGRDLITADALAHACFIRPRAGGGKRVIVLIAIESG